MTNSARTHPVARLLAGGVLLIGCLAINPESTTGLVTLPALALLSLLLNRSRPGNMARLLLAGSLFYAPVILLASPGIAIKGFSVTVIGLATVTSLGTQALYDAVLRLPLPATVRLLMLQMVHQSEVLRRETARIHQAVNVRGGVSGVSGVWAFAQALPQVWLSRIVLKAERVGMAMDLREYGRAVHYVPHVAWSGRDLALCAGSVGLSAAAVWISGLAWI